MTQTKAKVIYKGSALKHSNYNFTKEPTTWVIILENTLQHKFLFFQKKKQHLLSQYWTSREIKGLMKLKRVGWGGWSVMGKHCDRITEEIRIPLPSEVWRNWDGHFQSKHTSVQFSRLAGGATGL